MSAIPTSREQEQTEAGVAKTLLDRLWPLPRSLTGDGVRRTHQLLGESIPLRTWDIPSGTQVFDWTVPKEWRVNRAYVIDPNGQRRWDFDRNNLHLVNYSVSFRGTLSKAELDGHLYSKPDVPDAIPYVTSYYRERWGFCVSHRDRMAMPEGDYQVVVDTELFDGGMTLSEAVLPGSDPSAPEILITSHTCHPSMANDQLSGPVAATLLCRRLSGWTKRRRTVRFLFIPETIGSIAWLAQQRDGIRARIYGGYVCCLLGNADGAYVYRRSRDGDTVADRAAAHVIDRMGLEATVLDFNPSRGNDQRQFCSPGFNLPIGCLIHDQTPKPDWYHTSLDNLDRLDMDTLLASVDAYERMCFVLDRNRTLVNLRPYGEPFLSRHGLYPDVGQSGLAIQNEELRQAYLWLLNQSDGTNDLLAIAERSGLPLETLDVACEHLIAADLLADHVTDAPGRGCDR